MNPIFLSFLLAASPALSSTVAVGPETPDGACTATSVPATEDPYYSIWINSITGAWDCGTHRNREEAVDIARRQVRFWSDRSNIHGCQELHTTKTKGAYAVVRAATSGGYRFIYVFGHSSTKEALRYVTQLAKNSGFARPEFVTSGTL